MATRVRDWATIDYYDLLGVPVDASGDDIARAFRAAAKSSHPDATGDPDAAEHFKDLVAAYHVLSDRRIRHDYDRVRAGTATTAVPRPAPAASAGRAAPAKGWSRRRAWTALISGIVLTVLGIAVMSFTIGLREHDAHQRARFVPVAAQRLGDGDIQYDTEAGQRVVVREPHLHGEGNASGATVNVRYDPANPRHVVLDASTFGRDITLAIVALKLLVGGPVFAVLGARRLRRL